MKRRVPSLCLAAVLLAACGPSSPGTPDAGPDAGAPDGGGPDAGPGLPTLDDLPAQAADALCGALSRCCGAAEAGSYFQYLVADSALAEFKDRVPPAKELTAAECRSVLAEMLAKVPLGSWTQAARDGLVEFDAEGAGACLAELRGAACGEPTAKALYDATCFDRSPPSGGDQQRRMFKRTSGVGETCVPVRDGFGGVLYGTCNPSEAFCCFTDATHTGCQLWREGSTGTCRSVGRPGDACSYALPPLQLCATGIECDDSINKCAPAPVATLGIGAICASETFLTLGTCTDGWCDFLGTRRCKPLKDDDAACTDGWECRSHNCIRGFCHPFNLCIGELAGIAVRVTPESASLLDGETLQLSAVVTGTENTAVAWRVRPAGGGTVDRHGLYTAPATGGLYEVVAASVASPASWARSTITVTAARVTVEPAEAAVVAGTTRKFAAKLNGEATAAVTWSVQEAGGGTVDADGTYHAPATPGDYRVVATSTAHPTRKAVATVHVQALVLAVETAHVGELAPGGTATFVARMNGEITSEVDWSVEEAGGGSITSAGVYTAPWTAGTRHVRATSRIDTAKHASAAITVRPMQLAVEASATSIRAGATATVTAKQDGAATTHVDWSVDEAGGGSVSTDGVYTAPWTAGTRHVRATSTRDPRATATVAVDVAELAFGVTPSAPGAIHAGTNLEFTAREYESATSAVTWAVVEEGGGTITTAGVYTAPWTAGTRHVRATSTHDSAKVVTVAVETMPLEIAVTPADAPNVAAGEVVEFHATEYGAATTAVAWSVDEAAGGGVTSAGVYTAPAIAGTYHVRATSTRDATRSAAAAVTVHLQHFAVFPDAVTDLAPHGTKAFSATWDGEPASVVWSVQEAGGGSITTAGVYTAPWAGGTYHVVATSTLFPERQATATVVVRPLSLAVNPASTTNLAPGATLALHALQDGVETTDVGWTVQETGGGTVGASGTYTAPMVGGTYHVVATSRLDLSRSATATVQVRKLQLSVSPKTPSVAAGAQQAFTATVEGAASTAVTWAVQEQAGGSISATGTYTAPWATGTYHVVATSTADDSVTDAATITVAPLVVAVTPASAAVASGATQQFAATINGAPSTEVTWSVVAGGAGGTISETGLYTAPAGSGSDTVRATSTRDATRSADAAVAVGTPAGPWTVTTLSLNDGFGGTVALNNPQYMATLNGDLLVSDYGAHCIRRINRTTLTTTPFAGICGSYGNDGAGVATAKKITNPKGIAVAADGTVYFADYGNNCVRKVDTAGNMSAFAGTCGTSSASSIVTKFYRPTGVAIDPATGNVLVADALNNALKEVTPAGAVSLVVGCNNCSFGFAAKPENGSCIDPDGYTSTSVKLANPTHVTVANGLVYVTDMDNNVVRAVTRTTGSCTVATVAGKYSNYDNGYVDGAAVGTAKFKKPVSVWVASDGIYVADTDNHLVRRYVAEGATVETFAGLPVGAATATSGSADGLARSPDGTNQARFYKPVSILGDGAGGFYVTDSLNHKLRRISR